MPNVKAVDDSGLKTTRLVSLGTNKVASVRDNIRKKEASVDRIVNAAAVIRNNVDIIKHATHISSVNEQI